MKVCMWVRWIASPKHPQSISGLKITSSNVSRVKNPWRIKAAKATVFLHTPVMSAVPMIVSASANATPKNFDAGSMKPRWRKSK